jgi:hypothetical protein
MFSERRQLLKEMNQVYNLVVQRDNRPNLKMAAASRDIAEAAKDDRSAMRTLALMSIVILPVTFVALISSLTILT